MLVFASEGRSYRTCRCASTSRRRSTGTRRRRAVGLTRVRQFAQDDAHIFVMESQIGDEVERLLRLVQRVYDDSPHVRDEALHAAVEFLGEVATWDHARPS